MSTHRGYVIIQYVFDFLSIFIRFNPSFKKGCKGDLKDMAIIVINKSPLPLFSKGGPG
jgi:hypothetical protein